MRLARACLAIATVAYAGALRAEEPLEATPVAEPQATPAEAGDAGATRGAWSFSADYLFLKPSVGDTFFVVSSPGLATTPTGDRKNNDPDYHSGFRVAGGYQLPESDREVELAYTWLSFDQAETVAGEFLFATLGAADAVFFFDGYDGIARSDLDLTWQRVDASFSQPLGVSDLDLSLHFGVEFAHLRLREEYLYRHTSGLQTSTVGETSRTWGIGPELGLGLDYAILASRGWLPGDLSVDMFSSASLLISQADSRIHNVRNGLTHLDVSDEDTSRIVPALHMRVGLTYGMPVMGLGTSLSIGYQLDTYLKMLTDVSYPDDIGNGLADTDYQDFDAQGLYVSAGVRF